MLKIAFRRIGRKKLPIYQVVVQDKKKTRRRNFIAKLGIYMPLKNYISIDIDQVTYWLRQGAQPTKFLTKILTDVYYLSIKN